MNRQSSKFSIDPMDANPRGVFVLGSEKSHSAFLHGKICHDFSDDLIGKILLEKKNVFATKCDD